MASSDLKELDLHEHLSAPTRCSLQPERTSQRTKRTTSEEIVVFVPRSDVVAGFESIPSRSRLVDCPL